MFNVADGALSNLTDDGVTGNWRGMEVGTIRLDYLPMWDRSGNLYFWRTEPISSYEGTLDLYRIPAAGGEAELVRSLTDAVDQKFPMYTSDQWYMDGVSAISPDGTKVAMILNAPAASTETAASGLWVVQIDDADAPPVQLANPVDFQSAVPDWQIYPASPFGLSWTEDSSALVVAAYSYDVHFPFLLFYHFNLQDGAMTPVVDFTQATTSEELYTITDPATNLPLRYFSPWTGSLAPDNQTLLMYNDWGGVAAISESFLPPPPGYPNVIHTNERASMETITRTSRGGDKVIMLGILFTVAE